ncbi:putative 2OG-Fe(II) oxygenase [Hephaestia sp. GCM10023244]|uniref:putative 2OG-Fe(II) oxygenase n=1 Tax=unclassified Hephaestia TaxID=2631281 RepID=UPI0020773913|nr:putative 2OG-Fe(II) oxygenase [Hephaestia sp. MAHUQ-44]MCM8729873.1 putative 2OG-Fe(II) oxygenase [Hephaestia sp. MAHUQ-44]
MILNLALVEKAETALAKGDFAMLRTAAQALIDAAPDAPRGWHLLGIALRQMHELGPAADAIDRATALAPTSAPLLHLRALLEAERGGPSLPFYTLARAAAPDDPEIALGEAVALCEAGNIDQGLDTLDAISATHPAWVKAHATLAKLLWESGRGADLAAPFHRAIRHRPDNPDLHTTLIALLMQAGRYGDALNEIHAARQAFGAAAWFDEAEAVCASETGQIARADRAFGIAGDTPGVNAARARHALRAGRFDEAAVAAEQAVAHPQGKAAWPYLAAAWRLLDDPRWAWLEGDSRLFGAIDLGIAPRDLEAIAALVRSLHTARQAPLDQSLRLGTQTPGSILDRPEPELRLLREAARDAVHAHLAQLPSPDPRHPVLREARDGFRFAGSWSSLLEPHGYHTSHIHPAGWFSSALYLALPPSTGDGATGFDGWLQFGAPPAELNVDLPPFRRVEPRPGLLALFPSITWHGTVPFATGERLTIAFDVVSAAS